MIETYSKLEHKCASVKAYLEAYNVLKKLKDIENLIANLMQRGAVVPDYLNATKFKLANELRYQMTLAKIHERLASATNQLEEDDFPNDDIAD